MSRGIRDNWEGLKIRNDKTKKTGKIVKLDEVKKVFVAEFDGVIIEISRTDFSVLRNQN